MERRSLINTRNGARTVCLYGVVQHYGSVLGTGSVGFTDVRELVKDHFCLEALAGFVVISFADY